MVVCLGELVVDFISTERVEDIAQAEVFHRRLGGSPANVAAGLSAAGVDVRLVSKIGRDALGRFLRAELRRLGVADSDVVDDPAHPTRCVFIAHDGAGNRKITIANRQSADQYLDAAEVDPGLLDAVRVLHVGGTVFLGEQTARTANSLIERAKRQGLLISFDPNIPLEMASPRMLRDIRNLLPLVDVLKVNLEERETLYRMGLLEESIPIFLLCTDGAEGAWIRHGGDEIFVPAMRSSVTDTTGAGDAFLAGFLASMLRSDSTLHPAANDLASWGSMAAAQAARVIGHIGGALAYTTSAES